MLIIYAREGYNGRVLRRILKIVETTSWKNFDKILRPSLKEKFDQNVTSLIIELKQSLNGDLENNLKEAAISACSNALEGNEQVNIDFLKVYRKHIEERFPNLDSIVYEVINKIIDSTIDELRSVFIEGTFEQIWKVFDQAINTNKDIKKEDLTFNQLEEILPDFYIYVEDELKFALIVVSHQYN